MELVFILMVFLLSSATPILSCRHCHHKRTGKHPPVIPPVTVPKLPPVTMPPPAGNKKETCPIETLKLGGCVGGLVHMGLSEAVIKQCCPILVGLVEVEAAACLCASLKMKEAALNLNKYVPLALQLLITCGKTPPPGYTCSI
ncbi:pEARLI1-like lipid transfer protein 1 [Linum grandiflorum]